jgi:hypothetical protein
MRRLAMPLPLASTAPPRRVVTTAIFARLTRALRLRSLGGRK